ncbi:MAG TPA: enoyl-CoA hydratase-related protein [Ktedonobacteraceae bacterium]|nr:enoyl-CoA hydratase-related protein [Ktedonobacteraceae bacterium]
MGTEIVLIEYSHNGRIATVTMNRPEVHNALNTALLQDLTNAFAELSRNEDLSAVVLTGAGKSFSAGADMAMMQMAASYTQEQNRQEAQRLNDTFEQLYRFPAPIIARVNGATLGGGLGLLAVCDIGIAVDSARLAFSEVKLGIAPAVISPYVISKIGTSWARRLFITGERFTPVLAREIGLLHTVVTADKLDAAVTDVLQELLSGGPHALRACKMLARDIGGMERNDAREITTETIARLRVSEEGQEGLRAFLEKRKPAWVTEQKAE